MARAVCVSGLSLSMFVPYTRSPDSNLVRDNALITTSGHGYVGVDKNAEFNINFQKVCSCFSHRTGMFSRGNHHDQISPGAWLAPLTSHSTLQPSEAWMPCDANLSAHYFRLETLLDSALATLTLIRDTATLAAPPTLSSHVEDVLRALYRHTIGSTAPDQLFDLTWFFVLIGWSPVAT
jgi:hypothetical protein